MEYELETVNWIAGVYNDKLRDIVEVPIVPEGFIPVGRNIR